MDFTIDWNNTKAALFRAKSERLQPIIDIDEPSLDSLIGLEEQKRSFIANMHSFVEGKRYSHTLLWGSRGCGKSTLAKAGFALFYAKNLRALELDKRDLVYLGDISDELRKEPFRFVIFCDDMSFEAGDFSYKYLKTVMEGSLQKAPQNLMIVATSNRRHFLAEYQSDNDGATVGNNGELHLGDAAEERLSLADRFGLSISFYQPMPLEFVALAEAMYGKAFDEDAKREARIFAMQRGSYSARVAKQFLNYYEQSRGNE